jgi:hypothetical protein
MIAIACASVSAPCRQTQGRPEGWSDAGAPDSTQQSADEELRGGNTASIKYEVGAKVFIVRRRRRGSSGARSGSGEPASVIEKDVEVSGTVLETLQEQRDVSAMVNAVNRCMMQQLSKGHGAPHAGT